MNVTPSTNSRGLGASKRTDVFSRYNARAGETIMRPLIRVIALPTVSH